ncbi:MAG: hypothetical protein ACYC7D_08580 [Nitrososphaerales archaeon]
MKNSLIAISIVLAILVSGGIGYVANSTSTTTQTITQTSKSSTSTFTITQTITEMVQTSNTSTSTGDSGTVQLYQLEFVQQSNCPYGSWLLPWAVVLDNTSVVGQPSNATLPLTYNGTHLTSDSNYSAIWFSVPNGTYSYTILPKNFYGIEESGNVTIEGSNVVVRIGAFITAMGCSSATTTR